MHKISTWYKCQGHATAQLVEHCTASLKVMGLIPNDVTGIFHWHNPSGHTMTLRSTQLLTEMSTRNIFWGLVQRADNLTTFKCWLSWNLGVSTFWNRGGLSRPVQELLYLYLYKCQVYYPSIHPCQKHLCGFWWSLLLECAWKIMWHNAYYSTVTHILLENQFGLFLPVTGLTKPVTWCG